MIRAGIDEAGYGPLLGPLVVGLTAFRLDPRAAVRSSSLWSQLRGTVTKKANPRGRLLPVADSKELYQVGLAHLERTALAFSGLVAGGIPPRTVGEYLRRHVVPPLPPLQNYPWYRQLDQATLPMVADASKVDAACQRLQDGVARAGIEPIAIVVAPLLAAEFSQISEKYDSKAMALFDLNLALIEELRSKSRHDLQIICDRHGGRKAYADLLERSFPMAGVDVITETTRSSRYRVGRGQNSFSIEYVVKGESKGMEVALASIFAKYTRELFVEQLNRYFCQKVKGLRKTAGYYTDGHRFLRDLERIAPLSDRERRLLVRSR